MKKVICRFLLVSILLNIIWVLFAINVFAQCGADGKQPCKPTPKKKATIRSNKNTRNSSKSDSKPPKDSPSKKRDINSLNLVRNKRYSFIIMYKNSPKIQKIANQIRSILLKNGFKQEQLGYTSDPNQLYDYDRKANNSYLSFDSSVPLDVREIVTKLIQGILPDVHIDIMNKADDNYFLLWII